MGMSGQFCISTAILDAFFFLPRCNGIALSWKDDIPGNSRLGARCLFFLL